MSPTIPTDILEWEQLEAEEQARIYHLEKFEAARRWAKYERPNPFPVAYGYGSTLYKLKGDADNPRLSPLTRKLAAKAHAKILRNIADKRLMAMRERLIRANAAEDAYEMAKIQQCMRDYLGEDKETGLYEQREA